MRLPALVLLLAGALAAAGCGLDLGARQEVAVAAEAGELVIHNRTSRTVYYVAGDHERLAAAFWAPSDDPAVLPGVEPGATLRLRYPSIGVGAETKEIAAYLWHLVPRVDGGHDVHRLGFPRVVRRR